MLRRSFITILSTVAVLPAVPDWLGSDHPPAVPSEGNFMFWFHFHAAIERDRVMSTERAREKAIRKLDLEDLGLV